MPPTGRPPIPFCRLGRPPQPSAPAPPRASARTSKHRSREIRDAFHMVERSSESERPPSAAVAVRRGSDYRRAHVRTRRTYSAATARGRYQPEFLAAPRMALTAVDLTAMHLEHVHVGVALEHGEADADAGFDVGEDEAGSELGRPVRARLRRSCRRPAHEVAAAVFDAPAGAGRVADTGGNMRKYLSIQAMISSRVLRSAVGTGSSQLTVVSLAARAVVFEAPSE